MEDKKALLNLILDRRSCRSYQPQLPERSLLTAVVEAGRYAPTAVVEAGRYAPTAMNRQLTRFTVLTDPARLARLRDTVSRRLEGFSDRDCTYAAPALVLLTGRKDNPCALQDASCAMENMMLAAAALGLGSCWINQPFHLREDAQLRALLTDLDIPEDETPCCALALGLPAAPLFPGRRPRTGNPVVWLG